MYIHHYIYTYIHTRYIYTVYLWMTIYTQKQHTLYIYKCIYIYIYIIYEYNSGKLDKSNT